MVTCLGQIGQLHCHLCCGRAFFYGIAYARLEENPLLAIVKSIFSLCRIFIGDSDYTSISSLPGYDTAFVAICMYLIHTVGLFSTIGAAISALGASRLRKTRLRISSGGNVNYKKMDRNNVLTLPLVLAQQK